MIKTYCFCVISSENRLWIVSTVVQDHQEIFSLIDFFSFRLNKEYFRNNNFLPLGQRRGAPKRGYVTQTKTNSQSFTTVLYYLPVFDHWSMFWLTSTGCSPRRKIHKDDYRHSQSSRCQSWSSDSELKHHDNNNNTTRNIYIYVLVYWCEPICICVLRIGAMSMCVLHNNREFSAFCETLWFGPRVLGTPYGQSPLCSGGTRPPNHHTHTSHWSRNISHISPEKLIFVFTSRIAHGGGRTSDMDCLVWNCPVPSGRWCPIAVRMTNAAVHTCCRDIADPDFRSPAPQNRPIVAAMFGRRDEKSPVESASEDKRRSARIRNEFWISPRRPVGTVVVWGVGSLFFTCFAGSSVRKRWNYKGTSSYLSVAEQRNRCSRSRNCVFLAENE